MSDAQVGLFLAGNGLMVMLLQLPVAYLLDGRSKVAALAVGAILFAASSPPYWQPPASSPSPR